jgi:hypothetical protein
MAVTPNSLITPQSVVAATAVCVAAKTDLTTTTSAQRLVAAASNPNGGLVKRLFAIPRGTAPAMQLQLYRSINAGVTLTLADSAQLPAFTASTAAAVTKGDFGYTADAPLRLQAGEELWVGTGVAVAAGVVFVAEIEAF